MCHVLEYSIPSAELKKRHQFDNDALNEKDVTEQIAGKNIRV